MQPEPFIDVFGTGLKTKDMHRKIVYIIAAAALTLGACSKNTSCYSEELFQEYKDKFCTADCPGVIGCDGKKYCNECEANRRGIRVQ